MRAADEAAAAFGPPDILVNCAGINLRPPLSSLTAADWDLTLAVNLTAPFLLGQRFGPSMAARGWGRIINVTSQQAQRAFVLGSEEERYRIRGRTCSGTVSYVKAVRRGQNGRLPGVASVHSGSGAARM